MSCQLCTAEDNVVANTWVNRLGGDWRTSWSRPGPAGGCNIRAAMPYPQEGAHFSTVAVDHSTCSLNIEP